jgi:hypothetical protein
MLDDANMKKMTNHNMKEEAANRYY